ncbi:MAG: MarR family winged helix-turn-helix transcriptional regulator [Xanthobacteraceae bacterium]
MKYRQSAAIKAIQGGQPAPTQKINLGQLNNHLGYFLRRLQIQVFQDFIAMLKTIKLRPAQYSVLLVVEANPGKSQALIGQSLGIERARLARLLHELERRKWIRRQRSDGRSHSLILTREGETALTKIKNLAEKHEARIAEQVGHKRRMQLMVLLRDFG